MAKPHRHCSGFICALLVLVGSVSPALAQGDIRVTAEVDRTTVPINDLLALTLTVAGDYQQLGEPQLPLLSGFSIVGSSRSSQFSMVNGVVTAQTVFTYRLQPSGQGTFTIAPIAILVNGSSYQTDPITVQVIQGAAPEQSPEPTERQPAPLPAPGGLEGQDFYVEADVDNPAPFVGQQITYRFRFYQAVNLFSQPRLDWPAFSGFWTEDLTPNRVFEQTTAERLYRVTEVRQALFPTTAGETTIEPSTLTIPGDFFSRDTVLKSEPVVVDVQPLPTGAPDDFEGTVGQLEITAQVEPVEGRVNEPVTLLVRVCGAGNLTTLPDPTEGTQPLLSDWRVYDPQITTNVRQEGDTIQGEKVFERLLVPKTEGDLRIPPVALVFFDPQDGEYRRIETDPLTVQVAPGDSVPPGLPSNGDAKQDIVVLASDIRHIKAAPPSLATHRSQLAERPIYWLGWVVPPLAVVSAWIWDRRRRRLSSDVAYARAQRARRLARKRLAKARRYAREDEDIAYAAVARALTNYMGDKLNLPSAGLTRDAIRQTLTNKNVSSDLIDRSLKCLDRADSGRFAPGATSRRTDELIAEADALITELEQTIHTT